MATSISFTYPDHKFWERYSELWHNSIHPSPFQSPAYIQFLAGSNPDDLAIFEYTNHDKLMGAVFFRKENNVYDFLSEIKADHNFFTLHRECTERDFEFFFGRLLEEVKQRNWALVLNYQPSWASYMEKFIEAGKKSGVFWGLSSHSVCPALVCDTPQEVLEKFNKVKNLRYYVNKLKKQQNAVFEAFTGEEELEAWSDQFCACHVKRWENTPTPSKYDTAEMREFNRNCLKAWAREGLLCRFSIRVGEERIAFNIALLQEKALVGHSQTYNLDFSKYSPGKALMYFIGEWMAEQGIRKIDFGKGGESYKYGMTNLDLDLYKIFISNYSNLRFVLKSKLEETARSNSDLIKIYRGTIKPRLLQARRWAQTGVKRFF